MSTAGRTRAHPSRCPGTGYPGNFKNRKSSFFSAFTIGLYTKNRGTIQPYFHEAEYTGVRPGMGSI
eukprot:956569-Rhodomonas_salina.4